MWRMISKLGQTLTLLKFKKIKSTKTHSKEQEAWGKWISPSQIKKKSCSIEASKRNVVSAFQLKWVWF
jgi:hypothetical protein